MNVRLILSHIFNGVPEKHKHEFDREILGNNLFRLKYISVVMLFLEIVIFIMKDKFYNAGVAIIAFILFDVFIIPVIWFCYENLTQLKSFSVKAVQYAFALAGLFFGMGLTFITQKYADLAHMYFMMIFGISFFLYIKPLPSLLILFCSYAVFYTFLPAFQDNAETAFVIRANALSVNVFTWIVSRFLFQMRLKMFLDKKIIQEKNSDLEELVRRDSMTMLYNHETAISFLDREVERCGCGHPMSIIIADIDDFKKINDIYGHLTGDRVIKKVAQTIKSVMRSSDHVCRYGGEEFLIIMPDTDENSAFLCAQKMQAAIRETDFGQRISPTVSGGVSQYGGETIEELIALTDKKLYRAKRAGKNIFK